MASEIASRCEQDVLNRFSLEEAYAIKKQTTGSVTLSPRQFHPDRSNRGKIFVKNKGKKEKDEEKRIESGANDSAIISSL